MKPKNILNNAGLISIADIKQADQATLIAFCFTGHYLVGFAVKELESRLCMN
jgi:hypothetical protein